MENEELLPKPQTDLPLPEKELNAKVGSASQGQALRSYHKDSALGENDGDKNGHQSKSKFLILGVVVIVIFLGIISAFILGQKSILKQLNPSAPTIPPAGPDIYKGSPTPNPTENWQSFISQKYGFTIKYPNTITPNEYLTPFYALTFKKTGAAQGEFSTYDILAAPDTFIAQNPSGYDFIDSGTINKLLSLTHGQEITIGTSVFKYTGNKIVGGQEAVIFDLTSTLENQTHQKRVIFQKDGNNYAAVNNNGDPNNQEDFNKFLSTFTFSASKFTDSNSQSSTNTSGWKTFADSNCNLSFKYPGNWSAELIDNSIEKEFCSETHSPEYKGHDAEGSSLTIDKYTVSNNQGLNNTESFASYLDGFTGKGVQKLAPIDKAIGIYKGKYFEYKGITDYAVFAFEKNGYIYAFSWNKLGSRNFQNEINTIISSVSL